MRLRGFSLMWIDHSKALCSRMSHVRLMAKFMLFCLSKDFEEEHKVRCVACDKQLTDYEATRKSIMTGEFIDLCNDCYTHIKDDIYVIDNPDNVNIEDVIDFNDEL
jgi:hypothetical protein